MTTSDRSDLLQGTLDMLILKTLEQEPLHGYAVAQRIEQTSRALLRVQQGSLYPALHRLENRRWLSSSWVQTDGGRSAKVYRLTARGRRQLEREVADWQRLSDAIGWILNVERATP
jgi:PadR family transcriptional regulator PadR